MPGNRSARRTLALAAPPPAVRWEATAMRPQRLAALFLGALAILAALLLLRDPFHLGRPSSVRQSRLRLQRQLLPETLLGHRLLIPRLTGGFRYSPFAPERGGALARPPAEALGPTRRTEPRPPGHTPRRGADRNGEVLAAQAILRLAAAPTTDSLQRAIQSLEAALLAAPDDPDVLTDLSALSYSFAAEAGEPIGYLHALALVDRALRLAPHSPEARFNRPLYLEALALWPQARSAWESFLELDSRSGWAQEARERLAAAAADPAEQSWQETLPRILSAARSEDGEQLQALMSDFRSITRRHLEEELLPHWGAAHLGGDAEAAAEELQVAGHIAAAYDRLTEDSLYSEAVAAIEAAQAARDEARVRLLAQGHRDFGSGEAIRSSQTAASLRLLQGARSSFSAAGSPFADRALFKAGACLNFLGRFAEGLAVFRAVGERAKARGHWNLLAESLWMEGLTGVQTHRLAEASRAYERALPVFERLGDLESLVGIRSLMAERQIAVGDPLAAWRAVHGPLLATRRIASPWRRFQVESNAGHAAMQAGYPEIGVELMAVALADAEAAQVPLAVAQLHGWLARLRHRAGRLDEARQSLEDSRTWIERVEAEPERARLAADLGALEGEMLAAGDPAAAGERLEEAIRHYRASGYRLTEAATLFALGRARLALGDEERAEAALVEAAAIWEGTRGDLPLGPERISLLGLAEETFDELIALKVRQGLPERALEWSERKRARALLDQFARSTGGGAPPPLAGEPLSAAELLAALPADRVVVEFALGKEQLSAWVFQAGTLRWLPLSDQTEALGRQIDRLRSDLRRGLPPGDETAAAALFDVLLRPILAAVPAEAPLILIPEGLLQRVPFAALWDRAAGRFVIEEHPQAVAPSASLYLAGLARSQELPRVAAPAAFVAGDPAYDEEAYRLHKLERSAEESEAVAALYATAELLLGAEATASRFLARAGHYEVVHFAGHALANPDLAFRSRLLFAAEADDPEHGALVATELAASTFPATRLVFLSACGTLGGPLLRAEGIASLARPFLAAGVPAVVGTLWDVDDYPASRLAIAFHGRFARGEDALFALQAAQLALLHSDDPSLSSPRTWAAFQLVGEASLGIDPSLRLPQGGPR